MTFESLTGKPTYYPKLADMTAGEVIFERGKYVDAKPGVKFKNQTNYVFEVSPPVVTDKGEFSRVAISAGQLTKAMENQDFGGFYKIVYQGKNVIEKGEWAGSSAHSFEVLKYTDTTEAQAAPKVETASESTDPLDEMMN